MMARLVILIFLVLALAEGFIDRGYGAPCLVAGRSEPALLFAAFVLAFASGW